MLPTMTMAHDTPEKAAVAAANTVLRCQVGSGLHGVIIPDTDDRDEMGLVIEGPEYVIGLKRFEQYEYRTRGRYDRSGPGDLDYVAYGLRKWANLAAAGNPTVLLPLFAPEDQICSIAWPGSDLRARPELVLSRAAGPRFLGYLQRQRARMTGELSQRTNRPELVARYGYDTKFAFHALRPGYQGCELIQTGRLTLPIPAPAADLMLDVRQGKVAKGLVLETIKKFAMTLTHLIEDGGGPLPERPDYDALNDWLTETYRAWWAMKQI